MQVSYIITTLFLVCCAVFDKKTRKIPLAAIMVFAVLTVIYKSAFTGWSFEAFSRDIAPGILCLVIAYATKESIGYGDGIIVLITGILLGFDLSVLMLLIAFLFSAVISGIKIVFYHIHRKERMAFIPFLLSAWGVMIFGL